MSETIQIFDPATNQDERFPSHGEYDTAFIKGEDIPAADIFEDTQSVKLAFDKLVRENLNLRQALRTSRRRTTNQRRELRRLAKLDAQHQETYAVAAAVYRTSIAQSELERVQVLRLKDAADRRVADLEEELAETETQLLETKIELVEEKSKKRGLFRR